MKRGRKIHENMSAMRLFLIGCGLTIFYITMDGFTGCSYKNSFANLLYCKGEVSYIIASFFIVMGLYMIFLGVFKRSIKEEEEKDKQTSIKIDVVTNAVFQKIPEGKKPAKRLAIWVAICFWLISMVYSTFVALITVVIVGYFLVVWLKIKNKTEDNSYVTDGLNMFVYLAKYSILNRYTIGGILLSHLLIIAYVSVNKTNFEYYKRHITIGNSSLNEFYIDKIEFNKINSNKVHLTKVDRLMPTAKALEGFFGTEEIAKGSNKEGYITQYTIYMNENKGSEIIKVECNIPLVFDAGILRGVSHVLKGSNGYICSPYNKGEVK